MNLPGVASWNRVLLAVEWLWMTFDLSYHAPSIGLAIASIIEGGVAPPMLEVGSVIVVGVCRGVCCRSLFVDGGQSMVSLMALCPAGPHFRPHPYVIKWAWLESLYLVDVFSCVVDMCFILLGSHFSSRCSTIVTTSGLLGIIMHV